MLYIWVSWSTTKIFSHEKTSGDFTSVPLRNRKNKITLLMFISTDCFYISLKMSTQLLVIMRVFSQEQWKKNVGVWCRLPSNQNWYFTELGKILKGGPAVPIRAFNMVLLYMSQGEDPYSADTLLQNKIPFFESGVCQIESTMDSVMLFCRK